MSTFKQKIAIKNMVENGGNTSKAMRDAGYSNSTAKNPKKLTESKGFKEICEDCGLTKELVVQSLVDDINAKPAHRKSELELAAKLLGLLSKEAEEHECFSLSKLFDEIEEDEKMNNDHANN